MERYTSPSRLEAEQRVLFRGLFPLIVGRASTLPDAHAFFTHDATGIPFLVTRDAWGTPHAFVNLCRHRGARLVFEERGSEPLFVCRYHGWTYDTCGRMTNVALSKCDAEQMRQESSLVSMKCATRHGFVWLGRGPHRDEWDLAADLGETDAALAALALDDAADTSSTIETVPQNWKLVVEELLGERGVFVFPSSFLLADPSGTKHVAVFPETVETSRVVTTTLSGGRTEALPAAGTSDRIEELHARIERTLAAHPRRF